MDLGRGDRFSAISNLSEWQGHSCSPGRLGRCCTALFRTILVHACTRMVKLSRFVMKFSWRYPKTWCLYPDW